MLGAFEVAAIESNADQVFRKCPNSQNQIVIYIIGLLRIGSEVFTNDF